MHTPTAAQQKAIDNCRALGQPESLVPDDQTYLADMLLAQQTTLDRISGKNLQRGPGFPRFPRA